MITASFKYVNHVGDRDGPGPWKSMISKQTVHHTGSEVPATRVAYMDVDQSRENSLKRVADIDIETDSVSDVQANVHSPLAGEHTKSGEIVNPLRLDAIEVFSAVFKCELQRWSHSLAFLDHGVQRAAQYGRQPWTRKRKMQDNGFATRYRPCQSDRCAVTADLLSQRLSSKASERVCRQYRDASLADDLLNLFSTTPQQFSREKKLDTIRAGATGNFE